MLNNDLKQKILDRQKNTAAVGFVLLMLFSSLGVILTSMEPAPPETSIVQAPTVALVEPQSMDQGGQTSWDRGLDQLPLQDLHPALSDIMWSDPGVSFGIISDMDALMLGLPSYTTLLEESRLEDHDNDGINDLADLDDDNDGIYDLLERFDGCYGTDPYDHDNDGILDADDWDDDNDGILEGPVDYAALEALGLDPQNVSTDRFVVPTTVHPWTNIQVGQYYVVDQHPFDHDNDGVTDEDSDGSGAGRYDEDDDNDGRIDQFTWPCDLDGDGVQDYFDEDDDNDGVLDELDAHPYDATITTQMSTTAPLFDAPRAWAFNEYRAYSGGVNYVEWENNRVNGPGATASGFTAIGQSGTDWANSGTPAFTNIVDGDLDSDGIPNFLDPDNDNDGTPDSSDTDDDNDGILDMVDPDDDNDGILDTCVNLDTNGDQIGDMTGERSGEVTALDSSTINGGQNYQTANGVPTSNGGTGTGLTVDIVAVGGAVTQVTIADPGYGYAAGDTVTIDGGNFGASVDVSTVSTLIFDVPGSDADGDGTIDCEMDYDQDLDDDRLRAFDQNYNGVYDWLDADMGGTTSPDNLGNPLVAGSATDIEYDTDNDGIPNENDTFPLNTTTEVATWNCPTLTNPNPANADPKCTIWRASFSQFNDWDGDGISNWDDVDDDNDGIIDPLDIDDDCDLDNDADLHAINGALYRDDGINAVDSDIDGDGLENDVDWDDDNDGIADIFDPDDGNCGVLDSDLNDNFQTPFYPVNDGGFLDGSLDSQGYSDNTSDYWAMVYQHNPFAEMVIDYNGYDGTTNPPTAGTIPEFYWYYYARWNNYNGGNEWDIDSDGDSLVNGLDTDQDGDGMPDWWDQDEGNDGVLDVNDIKMGGSIDMTTCGYTVGQFGNGFVCGYAYALAWHMPLNGVNAQFGAPYSTRPDANVDQGAVVPPTNTEVGCTPGAQGGCYLYDFGGDGAPESGISYTDIVNNRDAYITWLGLLIGLWQWQSDNGPEADFPDELGADFDDNDVDGDTDGDFTNDTIDIDDDYDAVYDWFDVDDDNDGIWDFFEVDTNDDFDDDNGQLNSNFFSGTNCVDNDDDGNDLDADGDGYFQAVWDLGVLSQGLRQPAYYDVDNDNDGVPDGEDPDDDNNGIPDEVQEAIAGCFWGEEQSTFDHDNDGIADWADDDWDGDGIENSVEITASSGQPDPMVYAFDHDNDGMRDDLDDDDDQDGMKDEDEVLLWPTRFGRNSTNPWDHDDFGDGEAMANPNDPFTGPDSIDTDDDNDTREDTDFDVLEEGYTSDACANGAESSDWDSDNDCIPDEDDKMPTYITLNMPDTLWLDAQTPAIFSGHVDWINPVTQMFEAAPNLPVQVHIEWTSNDTTALETIDVLTNQQGNFSVGQFLYPEDLTVGDNTTYRVYAEVTEMFVFNGNTSQEYTVGVEANLTVDYSAWTYFRSDEQPFWLDFKAHYTADWQRGLYDNRIRQVPVSFSIFGGLFGNRTHPTDFVGLDGAGYRTDATGWASLTFVQSLGINGVWKQVRWNSTFDNGPGQIPGAYEEILWNAQTGRHTVVGAYDYTNTSLPPGDLEVVAKVNPELAMDGLGDPEWPYAYMHGDESEPFAVRVMHRMNIDGTLIVKGTSPVYYFDSTINNGDGTFGNWATLWHQPALDAAGLDFNSVSALKPYPTSWDGDLATLTGQATLLRDFISANASHWFIRLTNGADSNVPPCGAVNINDPQSPVRCEIVPEMDTGDSLVVTGAVSNRTNVPWDADPVALQVDIDNNGQFLGAQETAFAGRPTISDGEARYTYNWTWFSQYSSGTYGMRVDFTNSAYYYTGNSTTLAQTGAYINVTVVGTTDFLTTSVPRLYRNSSTTIQAKLVDNALRPVPDMPVNWTWSGDGRTGVNFTDANGLFDVPFNVSANDPLGQFTLTFAFGGDPLLKGSTVIQDVWIVSRTYMAVVDSDPAYRQSGDRWDFTAQVKDDGKTRDRDAIGAALDGANPPSGGLVDVIFEGTDFEGIQHRQHIATLAPSAGLISLPEPQPDGSHLCFYDANGDGFADRDVDKDGLSREESVGCLRADITPLDPALLREDPESFLPDGFGPVDVILRFEENLPNEGCAPLDVTTLGIQGVWDTCTSVPGNDHFRVVMTHNANGFALIGRTSLEVDDQIVYTSEIDPLTGETVSKPMVVTGTLEDELGTAIANRLVRVNYEMVNGQSGPVACLNDVTNSDGKFAITCPLTGVLAGKAKVTVTYSSFDNNDAYRYENKTVQTEFAVFSNSTLAITEVGPFRSSVESYTLQNGSTYPVLYLKESFHVDARLLQANGATVGGKCLNIYLDPEENVRPISTIRTSDLDGTIEWFSGDPDQNPSLKGVETTGGKLEGFRTLRVAFEPDRNVPGGCDKDISNVLNGSSMDLTVLVRSRIDLQVLESWSKVGDNGVDEGDEVYGQVALLRDRINVAVENEEITFARQYWSTEENGWVTEGRNRSITNEQGRAEFTWAYTGKTCAGEPCDGNWRIIAYYAGGVYFAESTDNITHEVTYLEAVETASDGFFSTSVLLSLSVILVALLIAGALIYERSRSRRQVDQLRGLISTMAWQLETSNEYIAAIFEGYKSLVKHFRKYGFMKKVFETTREFETAVRAAFSMVPSDQLDDFLTIFEEARYSDHTIDASHRDRALGTLGAIQGSLTRALGEEAVETTVRKEVVNLYDKQTKAGEFVAADGSVRQAGQDDGQDDSGFSI